MYYRENGKIVDTIEAYRITNGNKKQSLTVLIILCAILAILFILQATIPQDNTTLNYINYSAKLSIILVLLLINNSD